MGFGTDSLDSEQARRLQLAIDEHTPDELGHPGGVVDPPCGPGTDPPRLRPPDRAAGDDLPTKPDTIVYNRLNQPRELVKGEVVSGILA